MPETKALTAIDEVKQNLMRMEPEFARILPKQVTAEKFVRIVITAVMNMPSLLECDKRSFYQACTAAAADGLIPDSKEGVIVPFKGKARWMPMIAGICKRVRNSGEIGDIDAQVVHENDDYKAWIDEKGRHFRFERVKTDRGLPILTFAYAIGRDGSFYFEEISEEDMAKIEAQARASDSPWKGPFKNEMKRKSALRRLAKYRLPSSTDLTDLTQREDDLYDQGAPENPANKEPGKPNRLKSLITEPEVMQAGDIEFPGTHAPATEVPL